MAATSVGARTCVTLYTMAGTVLSGPLEFEQPVKVWELIESAREARPGCSVELLLDGRILGSEEELAGQKLALTAVARSDYAACPLQGFEGLGFKEDLLHGMRACGFKRPVHVQSIALRPLVEGVDLLVNSCRKTGKTAAYLMAALQRVDRRLKATQVLVILPNCEIAMQTWKMFRRLAEQFTVSSCVAGYGPYAGGVQVVLGTPPAILNLLRAESLRMADLKLLVLDCVDESPASGSTLEDDLEKTFAKVPFAAQVAVFSEQLSLAMLKLVEGLRPNLLRLCLDRHQSDLTLAGMKEFYLDCDKPSWKIDFLEDLLEVLESQAVIFCNSRRALELVSSRIDTRDWPAAALHADLAVESYEQALQRFRDGDASFLVCTDVLQTSSAGIFCPCIIHYDLPGDFWSYMKRVGNTGKSGTQRCSVLFAAAEEIPRVKAVEAFFSTSIEQLPTDFADYV